jgi:hypothetical protein
MCGFKRFCSIDESVWPVCTLKISVHENLWTNNSVVSKTFETITTHKWMELLRKVLSRKEVEV